MGTKMQPPTGVKILAILYIIQAAMALGFAAMFMGTGSAFMGFPGLGALMMVCGAVFMIIGIMGFLIAWGLWTLRPWARMVAMIFAILGLINIPIGTIISIIIIIYLRKPEVKAAFRV